MSGCVLVVSLTWLPMLCEKILSPSVASCQAMESNNAVLRKEIKHHLIHTNEAYTCILYAHIVHVYMNFQLMRIMHIICFGSIGAAL